MAGLVAGEPEAQFEWHECYRDFAKNMYRTSYSDMSRQREVHVRSDYPSGFGGHIPSLRHDVLFRNTQFDRAQDDLRYDPSRDAHPSFQDHIAGIPTATKFPQGAKKPPSYGVVPHDGTTTMLKPPWGVFTTGRMPLSHRAPPPSMASGHFRVNAAGKVAGGNILAGEQDLEPPNSARGQLSSRGSSRGVRNTVSRANSAAQRGRMPTESEVLIEQVGTM
eukprot:TRINITY_DN77279_c0_g1_i1.p1 TRINITY_DN77279_c0_g1~~TRINITY_DN77279_c0_g1_i1.p1  ORF type:complete len:220 (-),score=34.27 TRINITY_DN77279_c0_g1_i1:179-838(-)